VKRTLFIAASFLLACSGNSNNDNPGAPDTGVAPTDSEPETNSDPLVVDTDKGKVRGSGAVDGAVFYDIPFAAAPTGALRFAPPEPRPAWSDVRDATMRGPACPQGADPLTGTKPTQNEDCLALNVWTPKLDAAAKAPVMVFIHGGSFTSGSGNLELYDGAKLSKKGVVVVTINYRLGALGFFASPGGPSGNQGILDQRAALTWVKNNIEKFGGDPGKVTIFGESAGAISVCLHTVSPGSKGLFHRAIAESGNCALVSTPLKSVSMGEDSAEERGERLIKDLGCTDLACARAKTADEILAKGTGGGIGSIELGFTPVIDGTVVPNAPKTIAGDVPLLLGANADEGTAFTTSLTINTTEDYERLVYFSNPTHSAEILKIYPASAFASPRAAYNTLLGDALFVCPARAAAKLNAAKVPTYLYHFTHVTTVGATYGLGAFHASELWFVFGNFLAPLSFPSAEEKALSEAIGNYWTSFAKGSDPTATVAWPKYTAAGDQHLVLDTTVSVGTALNKARCDALEKLVP
jgi:para-nitrobenzyl esterase